MSVKIVAILTALPGKTTELESMLSPLADASRQEPGNLRWDIWRDQADGNRFVLDELYVDDAAVSAHRESPHFKAYVAKVGDVAQRTVFVVDPVKVV